MASGLWGEASGVGVQGFEPRVYGFSACGSGSGRLTGNFGIPLSLF